MKPTLDATRASQATLGPGTEAGPGARLILGEFLLSQSGHALPGEANKPIVPPGLFDALVVTGLSPAGTRFTNRYAIDERGRLEGTAHSRPLGHVPYEITLEAKDGSSYVAELDITPKKVGSSHQGYEIIKGLELSHRSAPLPDQIKLGPFLLSQSGHALPIGLADHHHHEALLPELAGRFAALEITALSPGAFSNRYSIDAEGQLESKASVRPLGHVPYQLALITPEGERWTAIVDITPKKIGSSHSGYETIHGLTLVRENATSTADQAPLSEETRGFVGTGGATNPKPTLEGSAAALYFKNRG